MKKKDSPRGIEENKWLPLSRLAAQATDWKTSLDAIFVRAREFFIFDNVVFYQTDIDSNRLDVLYARATGRGKSAEADVSWGVTLSTKVVQDKKIIIEEPTELNPKNRLFAPFLLGLPVESAPNLPGALIFIRFGGPAYTNETIEIATYLSDLVTSVIRQKYLADFFNQLENEKKVAKLQADFINTISHELRSPLGFIKGYTTTLLRKDTNWDQATRNEFLEIIERETNNLTDLIDDLLDSSRLQSGQLKFDFQIVRIDSLLKDEVNRALLTNPNQVIKLELNQPLPPIVGDARRLAQVFDNLLSNARKYAPGSSITINADANDKHITVNFFDNGPGIPDQYISKLFSRFFRVPEQSLKAHGSGLGLFICKQIIENHEGNISVLSSQKGTSFSIELPITNSRSNLELGVAQ